MSSKPDTGGLNNPLAKARGLGSARSGVEGWIRLRVTAIGNAILAFWFIGFVFQSLGASHHEFTAMLREPIHAIAMILFIISVFYHATLGWREVVEDYFHVEWMKIGELVGTYLVMFAAAAACIFSVLKIAL